MNRKIEKIELLCVDVDGTMTDGSIIYGNSSLGASFALVENFERSQTPSLASRPKFSTNTKSPPQILEFEDSSTDSTESTNDLCESTQRNQNANSSIVSEKSGLCSCEQGNRTNGSLTKRTTNLPDLSPQDEFAEIIKVFNVKDGLALAYWAKTLNRKVAIITGRKSEILRARAKELGIDELLFMGIRDKGKKVRELKERFALDSSQIATIGDDLNDIPMFNESLHNFAPSDCADALKSLPNTTILNAKGGKGAVREAIEILLQKEGIYEKFVSQFL